MAGCNPCDDGDGMSRSLKRLKMDYHDISLPCYDGGDDVKLRFSPRCYEAAMTLLLISWSGDSVGTESPPTTPLPRKYVCNVCGKSFPCYEALDGHKHLRIKRKLRNVAALPTSSSSAVASLGTQPHRHVCPECGKSFMMGQALGGHMRKHYKKPTIKDSTTATATVATATATATAAVATATPIVSAATAMPTAAIATATTAPTAAPEEEIPD